MAKFYGAIGFLDTVETAPDVWTPKIVERTYRGDVIRSYPRWQSAQKVNDDVAMNNRISIISDPYANSHLGGIRYVVWHGSKWQVTGVEVQRPRLLLDIGALYNGGEPSCE